MLEPLSGAIARRPLAAIFGLGVAFLLALLVLVDTNHVLTTALGGSSNDQVGYISVARNLAESGKLESSLVYPSVLHQKTTSNALYVPGHYYALALSFWLLGYSPLSAFAPSLLGYLVASCALFIAVRRLYDPTTASLATLIFMTFPAHLIYSGMAMAELTLLAACMLCFAVFVYVPRRWKPYAGPLLLLLPVAFRETGAILVLPMAAVLVAQSSGTRARDAVIMLLLSLAVVAFEVGVLFGGRPSLLTANVLGGSFAAKYGDAFFQEQLSPSALDWMIAISKNLARNFDALLMIDGRPLVETGSLWFLFAAIPVGAALAFRNRDLLMCSFGAVAGVLAIVLMALYAIPSFKGVRFMLIAQPFAAVVLSRLLLGMLGREQQRKLLITALLAGTLVGSMGVWSAFRDQQALRAREVSDAVFLATLGHDETRLLVAPYWISFQYVLRNFPATWSFLPTDRRSLVRLSETHRIGTLVLPVGHPLVRLKREDVLASGFAQVGSRVHRGLRFQLFRER